MDLGLDQLTDDQLLELLGQACESLARREHYVRQMAQKTIVDQATKMKAFRAALEEAVLKTRLQYLEDLKNDVSAEVRTAARNGEIKLLTPSQEAKAVVTAALETRIALIDEAVADLRRGIGASEKFFFEISGDQVTVSFGQNRVQARHLLGDSEIVALGNQLRELLTR